MMSEATLNPPSLEQINRDLAQTVVEQLAQLELAKKAIKHVLTRIRDNPDVRYQMGAGTQSYELLKDAAVSLFEMTPEEVEQFALGTEPREPSHPTPRKMS
jgi:DNA-directed RNA polymerase subunit L